MRAPNLVLSTIFIVLSLLLPHAHAASVPSGFTESLVATGLTNPTAMALAPDGRIFICEQGGRLRVWKNGTLLANPFLTVTVNSSGERGLLGVAFDPDFANNQYVYIYYTATSPTVHNRLSRFTANGDEDVPGSEVILLELNNLSSATNHNGGAIHFGLDGKLYIAVGDNANGSNSQTLGNLLGKILRINKDGTIPTDNPFYNTATGVNRAIWALGLRNPFTFDIQRGTGRMFINDVGQNTWEEINDGIAGSNYGWPTVEGSFSCGTFRCPLHAYDHSNGCAITGGAFYSPLTAQFPAEYNGDYFFADYCQGWIRRYDPSANTVTGFATGITSPVDLKVGADGTLYYLARGSGSSTGVVYKIQYTANQAPAITSHPANRTVAVGQSASFSVSASGTAPLSYQWQRNSANISGANSTTYTLSNAQLSDSGAQFRCVVTNTFGNATSNQATLTVTPNNSPTGNITQPPSGTLYSAGQTVSYSGSGTDPEDGTLQGSAFTWQIDFHHDDHTHPFLQPTTGSTGGSFVIPTSGETSAIVFYRIYLTVKDSGQLTHTSFRDIHPRTSTVTLATNPTGLQLKLDGQPVATPHSFVGVVGMIRSLEAPSPQTAGGTNWFFNSWSDGGAIAHNISTPASNTTYTATYNSLAPTGDGLRGVYYNNKDFTGTTVARIDPTIDFDWAKAAPASGIAADTFSIRWSGHVQPQFSESFSLCVFADVGVRLWVNGQQILNRWTNSSGEISGSIQLTAGQKYTITLEYFEHKNRAACKLFWSSASQAKQIIPQLRLYTQ